MASPSTRLPTEAYHRQADGESQLIRLLREENRFLRAKLEGKGRLEVDPALQQKNDELTSRIARIQGQLAQLEARNLRLEETVSRAQRERDRVHASQRDSVSKLSAARKERDELRRRQPSAGSSPTNLESQLEQLRIRLRRLEEGSRQDTSPPKA